MLAINTQLSAEQRLTKNIVAIMGHKRYVAIAGVVMLGESGIEDNSDKCPTAYTNGRDDYYGREFISWQIDSGFRFVILHENYHKLFRHLTTWQWMFREDADLAGQSCDYAINLMIVDENHDGFATMPVDAHGNPMGLLDERFRGMDAAQIYRILKQEKEDNPEQQGGSSSDGKMLDRHDWEAAQDMTAEEQRSFDQELDQAYRQGAMTAGKVGSGGNRTLDRLLQPQVNWREVLREFITQTCRGNDDSTWRRPSRRHMAMGILRPSGISERVGELVIAIDTSGSIGQSALTRCLSEIKGVCDMVKPESVRVLYWDTEVCGDEQYGGTGTPLEQLTQTTTPKGGGGTDVQCVPDYIRDKNINAQAVIVLTDGYLRDWGTWSTPLLWTILDNREVKPRTGKTIHVNL